MTDHSLTNTGDDFVLLSVYNNPLCEKKLKKGSMERELLAARIGQDILLLSRVWNFTPFGVEKIKQNANPAWKSPEDFAEVRSVCSPYSEGTEWHQDGDTTLSKDQMDFGLILWAHRDPTEIRPIGSDEVLTPKPYEVWFVRNLACYHRRPPGLMGRRWHFRQRVRETSVPEDYFLISS